MQTAVQTGAPASVLWQEIRRELRTALGLRLRGDSTTAEQILKSELPARIAAWSKADLREKSEKKTLIERLMQEEQRRAEEAQAMLDLVCDALVERVASRIGDRLEKQIQSLIERQDRLLAEQRSPEAHAEVEDYFRSLVDVAAPEPRMPASVPLSVRVVRPAPAAAPEPAATTVPEPDKQEMAKDRIPINDIARMIDYVREQEAVGFR